MPLLLAALAVVIGIRVQLLLASDFPINDGALFYAFVQALARVFPHLPAYVDFNGLSIPFAYPPLSFWLSAAAVQWGADPLAIVHRAPILMNMAWVLLFAGLLLRTGHSSLFAAIAVLVFGTTFRSYEWLVMGGGLSRGMGSLFLLAALLALLPHGLWTKEGWNRARLVVGGACVGATLLSHLEWGILCTFCALACLALAQRRPAALLQGAVLLGLPAAVLVLPWIASVIEVHGLAPFDAASQTSSRLFDLPASAAMLLRSSTLLLPLVLFGVALALRGRARFWLVLAVASVWLIPRSGETPLALGVGVLAATGFLGLAVALRRWPSRRAPAALVAFLVAGTVLATLRAQEATRRPEHFAVLSPEARSAMAWISANRPGTQFAILREAPWEYNAVAEWFPVLAHADNSTTVQGREWLPNGDFGQAHADIRALDLSANCGQLLRNLRRFSQARYVWVEGIDLQARAMVLEQLGRSRSPGEWLAAWQRRLRGDPAPYHVGKPGALSGEGTAAGCFDAAGWQEVHANPRVRIFRVPGPEITPNGGVAD